MPAAASTSSTRSCPTSPGSSAWCRSACRRSSCASRMPRPTRVRREIAESLEVCAAPRLPADRQRLLARGARARRRLRPPGPGGPGRRRRAGHPGQGRRGSASRTHSQEELDIALAAKPDYVALGPIYETKLKAMKWAPQGLDRIAEWKARIGALPLVRHRRHHAGAGRRRRRGRRRQRRRDHRLLHPRRSRGAGSPVGCMGRAR